MEKSTSKMQHGDELRRSPLTFSKYQGVRVACWLVCSRSTLVKWVELSSKLCFVVILIKSPMPLPMSPPSSLLWCPMTLPGVHMSPLVPHASYGPPMYPFWQQPIISPHYSLLSFVIILPPSIRDISDS